MGINITDYRTTTGTTVNTAYVAQTPTRDHLAEARSERRGFDAARARLRVVMRCLDPLFGVAVYEAIRRAGDSVEDQADEFARSYEDAIEQLGERASFLAIKNVHGQHVLLERTRELQLLLGRIVTEVDARHKKSHRPLPEWMAEANANALFGFTAEDEIDEAVF